MTFLRQVTDAVATAVDPTIEARSRWPTEQKHPSANRAVAVAQTLRGTAGDRNCDMSCSLHGTQPFWQSALAAMWGG